MEIEDNIDELSNHSSAKLRDKQLTLNQMSVTDCEKLITEGKCVVEESEVNIKDQIKD